MANQSPHSNRPFDNKSVRRALRMLHKPEQLEKHPLAKTAMAQAKFRINGPHGKGWAIQAILLEAINSLKPHEGQPHYQDPDWHPYILLFEQYVKNRPVEQVAHRLGIERRTYYRWQDKAIAALANMLYRRETTPAPSSGDASRRFLFLAPPKHRHALVLRQQDLTNIQQKLLAADGSHRFAFYGLPGVGKTAFALELAHSQDVMQFFRDGVLWAGLGREPSVLSELRMWAVAVGLSHSAIEDLLRQDGSETGSIEPLARAIRNEIGARRMLLVIDDAWQLDAALAFDVGGPNCAYVLTTRHRDLAQDFAEQAAGPINELSEAEGLLLFNQIAPEVVMAEPDSALTLVRAVGGLPLAIILMARHAREVLGEHAPSLKKVMGQLQQAQARFRIEQSQSPTARHPSLPLATPLSLAGALSLSMKALPAAARHTLSALAIFSPKPNTFSSAAAAATSNGDTGNLDLLTEAGLLEERADGRYALHQTVADYARPKRLDSNAVGRVMRHYGDLMEAHRNNVGVLQQEMTNILTTLEVAQKRKLLVLYIDGANAFYPLLSTCGLYAVAEDHLARAHRLAQRRGDKTRMILTLVNRGRLHNNRGEYIWTLKRLPDGLKQARRLRNPLLVCDLTRTLGVAADFTGQEANARRWYAESLALAHTAHDTNRVIPMLLNMGAFEFDFGHIEVAEQHWLDALRLCRETNNYSNYSAIMLGLGNSASDRGDYTAAEEYYRGGLAVARQQGHREDICYQLSNLGALLFDIGRHKEAQLCLYEGIEIARETGNLDRISALLRALGGVLTELGRYEQARVVCEESLQIARKNHHAKNTAAVLAILGALMTRLGEYTKSKQYLQECLQVARSAKNKWHICDALTKLGELHLKEGKLDDAKIEITEALSIANTVSQQLHAEALFGMAQVRAEQVQLDEARVLGQNAYFTAKTISYFRYREYHRWLKRHKWQPET